MAIRTGHHVDVHARVERERSGLREVRGDAVVDELGDGVVVADDDAVESQAAGAASP